MFIWGCGHSRDVHKGHAGGAHAHGLDHCPLQRWERKDACFYSPSTPQLRGRDSGSFSQFPVKETEAQRKHLACARSLSPQKVPALVRVGGGGKRASRVRKTPLPGGALPLQLQPGTRVTGPGRFPRPALHPTHALGSSCNATSRLCTITAVAAAGQLQRFSAASAPLRHPATHSPPLPQGHRTPCPAGDRQAPPQDGQPVDIRTEGGTLDQTAQQPRLSLKPTALQGASERPVLAAQAGRSYPGPVTGAENWNTAAAWGTGCPEPLCLMRKAPTPSGDYRPPCLALMGSFHFHPVFCLAHKSRCRWQVEKLRLGVRHGLPKVTEPGNGRYQEGLTCGGETTGVTDADTIPASHPGRPGCPGHPCTAHPGAQCCWARQADAAGQECRIGL